MFSSNPQVQEQWSIMIFPIGLPPKESSRCHTFCFATAETHMAYHYIMRIYPKKTLRQYIPPSPGAVCPAIVTYGARTIMGDSNLIIPETLKTMIRAPPVSQASRKEPGPRSFKLVTVITLPPRPPKLYIPPPSAPGKAGIRACGKSYGREAHEIYGRPSLASFCTTGNAFAQASSERRRLHSSFSGRLASLPQSTGDTGPLPLEQ